MERSWASWGGVGWGSGESTSVFPWSPSLHPWPMHTARGRGAWRPVSAASQPLGEPGDPGVVSLRPVPRVRYLVVLRGRLQHRAGLALRSRGHASAASTGSEGLPASAGDALRTQEPRSGAEPVAAERRPRPGLCGTRSARGEPPGAPAP